MDLNELTTNENLHFDSYRRSLETKEEHVTKSYVDKDGVGHTPNGLVHAGTNEHEHSTIALDCTLFLFLMMAIGQFCKQISHKTGIPYTSIITVIGVVFGILSIRTNMGRIGKAIIAYSDFDPHLLLLIFLPALIFESAFNSDWHIFKVELG